MLNLPEHERSKIIEKAARSMLRDLFGTNVIIMTQLHFFEIEKEETEPEYYISEGFKHFDFWYNPAHDVIAQLSVGIADLYHRVSETPGDKYATALKIAQKYLQQNSEKLKQFSAS